MTEYYEDPDYIRCHEDRGLYIAIDEYLHDIPPDDFNDPVKMNMHVNKILKELQFTFARFTREELLEKINECMKCM